MSNLPSGNGGHRPIKRLTPEERAKRARKMKRRDRATTVAAAVLVGVGIVALLALVFGIGAAMFYLAWNLGVVNIAAACGAEVATINFWTALGGSFAVGILSRIFRRTPAASVEAKS